MKRLIPFFALAFALPLLVARAQLWQPVPMGTPSAGGGGGYTGPGDIVSGAIAWYSCARAYDATQASAGVNACTIRRASDSTTSTLTTQISGGVQSGATFCASTTCTVVGMNDQTGNGFNITAAAGSYTEPALALSAVGGKACAQNTASSGLALTSGVTIAAQPWTVSTVAKRTSGTSYSTIWSDTGSGAYYKAADTADFFVLGGGDTSATATDNAFHAIQWLANGGSSASTIYVDGSSTAVSGGTSATRAKLYLFDDSFSDFLVGYICEAGLWPSLFSSGNNSSINSNQHSYYGF